MTGATFEPLPEGSSRIVRRCWWLCGDFRLTLSAFRTLGASLATTAVAGDRFLDPDSSGGLVRAAVQKVPRALLVSHFFANVATSPCPVQLIPSSTFCYRFICCIFPFCIFHMPVRRQQFGWFRRVRPCNSRDLSPALRALWPSPDGYASTKRASKAQAFSASYEAL